MVVVVIVESKRSARHRDRPGSTAKVDRRVRADCPRAQRHERPAVVTDDPGGRAVRAHRERLGILPDRIGAPGGVVGEVDRRHVAVLDGLPEMLSATQAVVGRSARWQPRSGRPCTEMGEPALSSASSIGETLPELGSRRARLSRRE